MNVLFVSSGNSKNGINPIIQKQGESLDSLNISVDYFTVKGKGMKAYFLAIFDLRKSLKKKSYDIIHTHYALCGWVAFFARRREKLVLSFMGDDLIGSNKADGSISRLSLVMAAFNKLLAKLFFDATIVKSPQMLAAIKKGKNVHLIPNGVDIDTFKPSDKTEAKKTVGFEEDKHHIIFVSDPARVEKNYPLAEKVYGLMNREPVILHAVYGKAINEITNYYNAADTLLMTSFHEGSPNVVKEAMACNCPVVCTDIGDVRLLFGETPGCYIADFNALEIKEKLAAAVQFRKQYHYTTGRTRLMELQLDSASVAKKITDIYTTIGKKLS